MQRELAQQRGVVFFGDAFAAAVAEKGFFVAAVAADVDAHVFHHAQHGYVHLAEHFDAFFAVQQGDVLGCGDDNGAVYRDFLGDGELDVARARGHVEDEVVQFVPQGLLQQLHDGATDHGAAPDHGGFIGDDESHGVGLQAVSFHGDEVFVFPGVGAFALGNAQHHTDAGAVDVCVEYAHAGAFGLQRQGEVDGGGGFAHATLARGHGNDVLDAGNGLDVFLAFVGVDFLSHVDINTLNAINVVEGVGEQLFQGAGDAFGRVWQFDHHGDLAAVVRGQGFHRTQFIQVLAQVGVAVLLYGGFQCLL